MTMSMPDQKKKSFWERPEGTTGMITLAAGAAGLYVAAPAIITFLDRMTSILGSTMMLTCYGVATFILLNVVFNKKVQTLTRYMFKSAMRKITGAFVEIDPIGIMKNYIEELKGKREVMAEGRDKLKGQVTILTKQIDTNKRDYDKAMAMATVANRQQNQQQVQVSSRQALRLERLNEDTLVPLLRQLEVHLRAMNKYYEVTGVVIEDLKNEVEARKMERDMILASHSAMSAAKSILNGGADSKELFDQAMEFVLEDFGMKLGEIDSFIESSKSFVDGIDLQNGVYEEEAMRRITAMEAKADSILSGKKPAQIENAPTGGLFATMQAQSQNVPVAAEAQSFNKYL